MGIMKRLLYIIMPLLCFCGCIPPEEMLRNPVGSNAENSFKDIVIGAALPLSGKYAAQGSEMLPGAQAAVETLNQKRGINGRRVRLEICDTKSTPQGASLAMTSLAKKGATVIIGGYSTVETEGLCIGAQRERVPLIVPCATADEISTANAFVFRISCTDTQQAEGLAAYLWYWRQINQIGVLVDMRADSVYERNVARAVAQSFSDLGGYVAKTANYTDVPSCVDAMRTVMAAAPKAIVVSAMGEEAAMMVKALRKLGYTGVICGADGWDRDDFFFTLGTDFDPGECIYVTFFSNEYKDDEFTMFSEEFRKKFYHLPGAQAAAVRDAVFMAGSCIVNNADIRSFRRNWLALQNYFGASSVYSPLRTGDVDRILFINSVIPAGVRSKYPGPRLLRQFMHSKLETYKFD